MDPPNPKVPAHQRKKEDTKILALLQDLSKRLTRLEGADKKPTPRYQERFHPYQPQTISKRGRGGWRGRPLHRGGGRGGIGL